jgi:prepilin-type N-terminal cleavage/methylation domain-containing protein
MKQQQGFTLIEVLVALVVAVAAMTLLAQGFSTGARASTTAQYATRAAILGQRVITDFETGALSADASQTGSFDDDADFSYETQSEATDLTGLNKVTVTVKWKERNQDREYVLVRLLRSGSGTTSTGTSSSSSGSKTTTPTPTK